MSVVRVCIGSLHPSNDYSFHAMRKLQAIEARRGEERRRSKGAATTVIRCFHVHYGSRGEISMARGWRFGASHGFGFDRIYHPTERISLFVFFIFENVLENF